MRQALCMLAALVLGSLCMLAPAATAVPPASATAVVRAQSAPPTGEQPAAEPPSAGDEPSRGSLEENQRYTIGAAGAALIMLVFLMRKLRGKPYFGLSWRKRG
ncbi:hypothetical protein DFQ14_106216 [Halopolyspora algeriensis]|uniref:MYXO-CTERM domain-containing protein n=1 Tax=Halopolyspora algeriensis TaxID=1500506 RepID=A0A368VUT0_9ACTN|nr:hypothetical protein [Halopolyspora algeriensis]RCW43736.1 hypothetical protein DFQ14_106216 [Halopolyspora algeriensis]TQM47481.1 hypothetical protein FHU43_3471 [Halopolyspora algeriensis]